MMCPLSAQVVELQNRLSEESKKADKMEFEYKRVKEKVDSLQKEKDVCAIKCIIIRTGTVLFSRTSHCTFSRLDFLRGIRCMKTRAFLCHLSFCPTSKRKGRPAVHNFETSHALPSPCSVCARRETP